MFLSLKRKPVLIRLLPLLLTLVVFWHFRRVDEQRRIEELFTPVQTAASDDTSLHLRSSRTDLRLMGEDLDAAEFPLKYYRSHVDYSTENMEYLVETGIWKLIERHNQAYDAFRQRYIVKHRDRLQNLGKPRRQRSAQNPITIYSVDGQFVWGHLFQGRDRLMLDPLKCSVPCEFRLNDVKYRDTADVLFSWPGPLNFQKKPSQRRAVCRLEPDLVLDHAPPEDFQQTVDMVVGFPQLSEIWVNYFYAFQGRVKSN